MLNGSDAGQLVPADLTDKQRAAITRAYMALASKTRIAAVLSSTDVRRHILLCWHFAHACRCNRGCAASSSGTPCCLLPLYSCCC